LNEVFKDGPSMSGDKGFLLLYELLTTQYAARIQATDDPHRLGALLTRFLPPSQINSKSTISIFV
jgi:hypothetical protein